MQRRLVLNSYFTTIKVGAVLQFYALVHSTTKDSTILSRAQIGWGWEPEGSAPPLTFPEKLRLSPDVSARDLREIARVLEQVATDMDELDLEACRP